MKKNAQWRLITNAKPKLSAPRGKLQLVVNNSQPGTSLNSQDSDLRDAISVWTATSLKTILKSIKENTHPAALNAIQKLTVNHPKRLEIMMALFEARNKNYKQGA